MFFLPVFTAGYDPFDYNLQLFNRWGELIFESHDVQLGWDGTYKENTSQTGVYIWKIEFKAGKSTKRTVLNGYVNLLR
jgi:trimeric autotransporter adhesin